MRKRDIKRYWVRCGGRYEMGCGEARGAGEGEVEGGKKGERGKAGRNCKVLSQFYS